jgi:hypothetical protein
MFDFFPRITFLNPAFYVDNSNYVTYSFVDQPAWQVRGDAISNQIRRRR